MCRFVIRHLNVFLFLFFRYYSKCYWLTIQCHFSLKTAVGVGYKPDNDCIVFNDLANLLSAHVMSTYVCPIYILYETTNYAERQGFTHIDTVCQWGTHVSQSVVWVGDTCAPIIGVIGGYLHLKFKIIHIFLNYVILLPFPLSRKKKNVHAWDFMHTSLVGQQREPGKKPAADVDFF